MKKKKVTFKQVYLIYVALLVIAAVTAVIYVNSTLKEYERLLPEKQVEAAMSKLSEDAGSDAFFEKYVLPQIEGGRFEAQFNLKEKYRSQFKREAMNFAVKNMAHAEDELFYQLENAGVPVAEVKLKAKTPVKTKLTVLNFREWEVEYVKPILEEVSYSLTVPADFTVRVNDIVLTEEDVTEKKGNQVTYLLPQIYMVPDVEITDKDGREVSYGIRDGKILAEFYDYSLTLPSALKVEVNGEEAKGEVLFGNRSKYDIRALEKPTVRLLDDYGNEVEYDGGNDLPLTVLSLTADSRYTVTVNDRAVPDAAVKTSPNPEYQLLKDYVEELPQIKEYDIAVLLKDAQISIKDEEGKEVDFDKEKQVLELSEDRNALDTIPEEIAKEVDVLGLAQSWSLFMSTDKKFSEISSYLIKDSYQYRVAVQYATGEDITFTSEHTLLDPAFTENKVGRFVWITDSSFCVDISFVKHMRLRTGKMVDDPMNDRFYFVKFDDTDDGKDNPTWKIAGMKEIVNNDNQ